MKYDEFAQLLTHFNITLTDENGEYRSTYDILSDMAAKWSDIKDTFNKT